MEDNLPPNASSSSSATFAVRLVNIDVVSAEPIPGLDTEWCTFESRAVKRVPVIRIFGPTPAGQHCCVHIHNTLPYFFLDFPSDLGEVVTTKEKVYAYIHRLFNSIEAAMDLSLGRAVGREKGQYIHDIQIVRGKPFYGFALSEKFYLKVFLYNPFLLNRMTTLLRNGAIMQTQFQPYEAHIPYLLQFFVDYNLFGMSFVKFSDVKFRTPLPVRRKRVWRNIEYDLAGSDGSASQWSQQIGSQKLPRKWYHEKSVRDDQISPCADRRETTCDLEVDVVADDIINYLDRIGTPSSQENRKLVTSLAALWEDEVERRRREGSSPLNHSFLEIGDDGKRSTPPETLLARETRKKLEKIIEDERKYLAQNGAAAASPGLKEVPGRNMSFSTEQKQQFMSQGPLRQCPDLLDAREDNVDQSNTSSPASLFPNTPRANMTFGELQKHGIQKPDAASIAAAAKEMYPSASQMPLPDGSFAEPDVDEQLVLSQSASLDEGMVDILNWMQEDDEKEAQQRKSAVENLDRDLFEPKNDNGNDEEEDDLSEARDIEQSQREIEDEINEIVGREEAALESSTKIQETVRFSDPEPREEQFALQSDLASYVATADEDVDLFDDQDAAHGKVVPETLVEASIIPSISAAQPPQISEPGLEQKPTPPLQPEKAEVVEAAPLVMPPLRGITSKPLKSALKKTSLQVKEPSSPRIKREEVFKVQDNDEIVFTQPGKEKDKTSRRKRKEPPQKVEIPPKRVKFDDAVAVFIMAPDSLNFTDKKHIPIFFDDAPPKPPPIRQPTPRKGPMLSLTYDDGSEAPERTLLQRSSSSSLIMEDIMQVEPSPFAMTPDADFVNIQDMKPEVSEDDPLEIEMIRASQSDFHLPQPSPSQPFQQAMDVNHVPPPHIAADDQPSRVFPRLFYDNDDEDDDFADMVVGEVPSSPEVSISHPPSTARASAHVSSSKEHEGFMAQSPVSNIQLDEDEEEPPLQSTPPMEEILAQERASQENSSPALNSRSSSQMRLSLPPISPIKPVPNPNKSPSPNFRADQPLDDSIPAEQDEFAPHESPIKKSSGPSASLSVDSHPPMSTPEEEASRLVKPTERPLFTEGGLQPRKMRVFLFHKKPPSTRLIIKGLQNIGRPFLMYQEPFYGVSEDPAKFNQPKDKMIGNKIDLKAFTMSNLPQFGQDAFAAPSLKSVRKMPPLVTIPGPLGRRLRILTPARAPPSLSVALAGTPAVLQSTPPPHTSTPAPFSPSASERSKGEDDDMPASPMAWPGMAHHAPKITPAKVKSPLKSSKRNQDASQIEQPTPNNSFGFLFSQGFEPTIANSGESADNQGLTLLSLEVHGSFLFAKIDDLKVYGSNFITAVNTRGELRPDPKLDAVSCLYMSIRDESIVRAAGHLYRDLLILMKVKQAANPAEAATTDSMFDGLAVPRYVRHEYNDEQALFTAFAKFCEELDPDVIFGYEIQSASLGYLLDRAVALKIDLAGSLSRLSPHSRSATSTTSFFDKERDPWGFTHSSGIHIAGRSVVNIWRILRSEIKSTSYTFENTAFHVLHARVPLYTHKALTNFYNSMTSQWRVHLYYLERVQCNLYLLDALNVVGRTSEMARLYGITFFEVLSRGSQFRVESLVMRLTKPHNYILISPSKQQVAAQNAPECIPLVMEPQSGFYQDPLLVLDFQSLYPSIIIAYNYCYSTCLGRVQPGQGPANMKKFGASYLSVPRGAVEHLKDAINISPNEVMFLKPEVQVGILPRMLVEILETRVMVKNAMKKAKKDRALYRLLDARQLALKLLANVTYGYTSASFSGRMPCVDIADAIVQTARETLERAIRTVNSHPTWRARVVYGDTDSMFVLVEGATRERAFEVGNEIADTITSMNPWPVKLKFEKMYLPSLLLAKKRYVGYMYESKEQLSAVFDAKGIETVRRDSCPAVAKIMEKSLTLLFENRDLSEIRTYVQRQFSKMMSGRANLSDFIFRKEVRLGTYAPGKPAPPAALVATKEMAKDPRAEPQYGERVPYIVAAGHHQARLIDLVFHPDYFLKYPEKLRPNANYYITKQVIPSLARVFNLIGVDIASWYTSMPKNVRLMQHLQLPGKAGPNAKSRIDQYYLSQHCPICDEMTRKGLCEQCAKNKQASAYILAVRMRHLQQQLHHLNEVCVQCQGTRDPTLECVSLDCAVLFERNKVNLATSMVESFVKSLAD